MFAFFLGHSSGSNSASCDYGSVLHKIYTGSNEAWQMFSIPVQTELTEVPAALLKVLPAFWIGFGFTWIESNLIRSLQNWFAGDKKTTSFFPMLRSRWFSYTPTAKITSAKNHHPGNDRMLVFFASYFSTFQNFYVLLHNFKNETSRNHQ